MMRRRLAALVLGAWVLGGALGLMALRPMAAQTVPAGTIEGELRPLMAHLRYVKEVLEAPRRAARAEARHAG